MKKIIILTSMLLLVGLGCSKVADKSLVPEHQTSEVKQQADKQIAENNPLDINQPIKEFSVIAKKWEFEPSQITVDKGDIVKIKIKSIDVKHGISIPEFGVNDDLSPGKETIVEFKADKSGSFTFSCSVYCGSGHGDMVGTLIVK